MTHSACASGVKFPLLHIVLSDYDAAHSLDDVGHAIKGAQVTIRNQHIDAGLNDEL